MVTDVPTFSTDLEISGDVFTSAVKATPPDFVGSDVHYGFQESASLFKGTVEDAQTLSLGEAQSLDADSGSSIVAQAILPKVQAPYILNGHPATEPSTLQPDDVPTVLNMASKINAGKFLTPTEQHSLALSASRVSAANYLNKIDGQEPLLPSAQLTEITGSAINNYHQGQLSALAGQLENAESRIAQQRINLETGEGQPLSPSVLNLVENEARQWINQQREAVALQRNSGANPESLTGQITRIENALGHLRDHTEAALKPHVLRQLDADLKTLQEDATPGRRNPLEVVIDSVNRWRADTPNLMENRQTTFDALQSLRGELSTGNVAATEALASREDLVGAYQEAMGERTHARLNAVGVLDQVGGFAWDTGASLLAGIVGVKAGPVAGMATYAASQEAGKLISDEVADAAGVVKSRQESLAHTLSDPETSHEEKRAAVTETGFDFVQGYVLATSGAGLPGTEGVLAPLRSALTGAAFSVAETGEQLVQTAQSGRLDSRSAQDIIKAGAGNAVIGGVTGTLGGAADEATGIFKGVTLGISAMVEVGGDALLNEREISAPTVAGALIGAAIDSAGESKPKPLTADINKQPVADSYKLGDRTLNVSTRGELGVTEQSDVSNPEQGNSLSLASTGLSGDNTGNGLNDGDTDKSNIDRSNDAVDSGENYVFLAENGASGSTEGATLHDIFADRLTNWADSEGNIFVNGVIQYGENGRLEGVVVPELFGSHRQAVTRINPELGRSPELEERAQQEGVIAWAGEMHFRIVDGKLSLEAVNTTSGTLKPGVETIELAKQIFNTANSGFDTTNTRFLTDLNHLDPQLNDSDLVETIRHDAGNAVHTRFNQIGYLLDMGESGQNLLLKPFFWDTHGQEFWDDAIRVDPAFAQVKSKIEEIHSLTSSGQNERALSAIREFAALLKSFSVVFTVDTESPQ